jgi:PTS system cellobiose-specific IIB component
MGQRGDGMKKIILFCGGGFSSSLLVLKMREAAKARNFECVVDAFTATKPELAEDADVVLLGPQIRFRLNEMRAHLSCPVEIIETVAYGTMNGEKVLQQAIDILEKNT